MAAMLCEFEPDDEIIMPSYTFVSTANAFVRCGAKPVFVDIREDTLNLDENQIENAITDRTKAIVPVHYAGVGCEMDRIMEIAAKRQLMVIEDAAQGVNARYRGRALGGIGHLGTYSFHETKNYICGEGGALCVNDANLLERAEIIRDKGTNRKNFARGKVDKYTWVDLGSSYVSSEILSAFLYAQLELFDTISERRKYLFELYYESMKPLADEGLVRLPVIPRHCESNYHMFYILVQDQELRDGLIEYLKQRNIYAVFHYVPLHNSPMGLKVTGGGVSLPVTEELSRRLVRLPLYYQLQESELLAVVEHVGEYLTANCSKPIATVEDVGDYVRGEAR
jgi:dTDP-4-amino-4,6-dideoxygalactose transaminase